MRLNVTKEKAVDLEELDDVGGTGRHGREFGVSVGEDSARLSELINNAAHSHFEMPHGRRLIEEGSEARAAAEASAVSTSSAGISSQPISSNSDCGPDASAGIAVSVPFTPSGMCGIIGCSASSR